MKNNIASVGLYSKDSVELVCNDTYIKISLPQSIITTSRSTSSNANYDLKTRRFEGRGG